jgi:hypothetical protein
MELRGEAGGGVAPARRIVLQFGHRRGARAWLYGVPGIMKTDNYDIMARSLLELQKNKEKSVEVRMNAKINKTINGLSVSANPIYKNGLLPAYWSCAVNEHVLPQTFSSASEVFRFAQKLTSVNDPGIPR